MSVQRYAHTWATDPPLPADNGKWVTYADHARIVAEAAAEARAAERRHWEARFRNAEQAHEAALVADQVNTHGFIESVARHESMLAEAKALLASRDEAWDEGYAAGLAAAAPRILTADDRSAIARRVDAALAAMPTGFWINANTEEAQAHKRYVRDALTALIHDGGAA